jgi:hypothetical protein
MLFHLLSGVRAHIWRFDKIWDDSFDTLLKPFFFTWIGQYEFNPRNRSLVN